MQSGHLFSGAGGGLYSDLILGHEPVFAVEHDKYCCKILRQRAVEGWFPGLYVHEGDVQLFDPSGWKDRVDIINAGFPCQDISTAGNGAGIEGEKSGLWKEVVRVAGIIRPERLFLENSPAITSRGLGVVLGDLANLGYDARWCVLPASAVGAPHIRARWWCLAVANASSGRCGKQEKGKVEQPRRTEIVSAGDVSNTNGTGGGEYRPGECDRRTQEKQTDIQQKDGKAHASDFGQVCCFISNINKKRLQERKAFTGSKGKTGRVHKRQAAKRGDWWQVESDVDRMVDELATGSNGTEEMISHAIMGSNVTTKDSPDEEKTRTIQKMSALRKPNAQETVRKKIGRSDCIQESEILRSTMHGERDDTGTCDTGGVEMESGKVSQKRMREMQHNETTKYASYRRESSEQQQQQSDDTMCRMPHKMALGERETISSTDEDMHLLQQACTKERIMQYAREQTLSTRRPNADKDTKGIEMGAYPQWWEVEPDIGRATNGVADRVNRIKALGNGQVPLQAAAAYMILSAQFGE